eukprot:scaffold2279_cov120-Skeletonema_dohrnii-CCMP3373.AAC.2
MEGEGTPVRKSGRIAAGQKLQEKEEQQKKKKKQADKKSDKSKKSTSDTTTKNKSKKSQASTKEGSKKKKKAKAGTTKAADQVQKNLKRTAETEADKELRRRVAEEEKRRKALKALKAARAAKVAVAEADGEGESGTVTAVGGGKRKAGPGRPPNSSGQKKSRKATLSEEETERFLERRSKFNETHGDAYNNPVAWRTEVLLENLKGVPKELGSDGKKFDVTGVEMSLDGGDMVRYHVYDPNETNMMLCLSCMNKQLSADEWIYLSTYVCKTFQTKRLLWGGQGVDR